MIPAPSSWPGGSKGLLSQAVLQVASYTVKVPVSVQLLGQCPELHRAQHKLRSSLLSTHPRPTCRYILQQRSTQPFSPKMCSCCSSASTSQLDGDMDVTLHIYK